MEYINFHEIVINKANTHANNMHGMEWYGMAWYSIYGVDMCVEYMCACVQAMKRRGR